MSTTNLQFTEAQLRPPTGDEIVAVSGGVSGRSGFPNPIPPKRPYEIGKVAQQIGNAISELLKKIMQ